MDLFEKFASSEYFEKWYECYRDSDNFEEYVWYTMDERREELESDELTEDEIEKELERELKRYAQDWFEDHIYECLHGIEDKIKGDRILLCRALTVKCRETFLENCKNNHFPEYLGIGVCWSWDHPKADAHWGSVGKLIEVYGYVKVSEIDWDRTINLNLCPVLGFDEAEIRLKSGAEIEIVRVDEEQFSARCAA